MCPLYPGMSCREHCDAAVDIETERDEDLITVPFIELCPNSWLVPPNGKPQQIPEKDQFVAKKVMDHAKAMQKTLGDSLPRKAFDQIGNALAQAEGASRDEEYTKALQAYAGIEKLAKKAPPSLLKLIESKMAELDEEIRYEFEDVIEAGPKDKTTPAQRAEKVRNLLKAVDVTVFGKRLPLVADMRAWLEKNGSE